MFKKILVPLDGSPLAELALPRAVELARETGATITLLQAVEAHSFPGVDATRAEVEVVRKGEEYLGGAAERLASQGVKADTSVWYGPPAFAITEAARFGKFDLIVMTTHGRSGLERLFLGSVAEAVLRGTPVPVLLVRASEAQAVRATEGPWPADVMLG